MKWNKNSIVADDDAVNHGNDDDDDDDDDDDELVINGQYFFSTDLLRHINKVPDIPWPTWTDCRRDYHDHNKFKKMSVTQFSSTWVSVSAKNMK